MQKLSELIGKPLFTRTGELAGTVKNALLAKNLRILRAFEYFDDQEDEHTIPLSSVVSAEDALIVRSLAERQYKDAVPAPFGIAAYSETGENLGNVCDFGLNGADVTALVLTGGREIETARVVSIGDALIADIGSPLPVRPAKASRTRAAARRTERAEEPEKDTAPRQIPAPQAVPKAGSALLTGKRVPEDVRDARGDIVVRKDTVITAETLRRAMAHNKLFELTLSVLSQSART